MRDLLAALAATVDNARQISATVGQQSAGIQQISDAMNNVAEGGERQPLLLNRLNRRCYPCRVSPFSCRYSLAELPGSTVF